MGFRVLILTDTPVFSARLETAFEDKLIELHILPITATTVDNEQTPFSAEFIEQSLEGIRFNLVIHAMLGNDNLVFAQAVTRFCQSHQLPLLHLSSFRVFGSDQGGVDESVEPRPNDALGEQLLSIEKVVLAIPHSLVLRVPTMLRGLGDAVLDHAIEALLADQPVMASEDICLTLYDWPAIANMVVAMTQQVLVGAENWGVFHCHSSDVCSEAEFIDAISRLVKSESLSVQPFVAKKGQGSIFRQSAWLQGRRCTNAFGIQLTSFRVGLKSMVHAFLQERNLKPVEPDTPPQ